MSAADVFQVNNLPTLFADYLYRRGLAFGLL
jgi:hypothetical protein